MHKPFLIIKQSAAAPFGVRLFFMCSVDILSQKKYSYTYEEGRITRAVESDVVLNESQMIVSKTIVHTLRYIYDQEGNLLRKHSVTADGTQQISYSENDANDCTMVKIQCGDHEITSHSKTDSFGRKEFDEIQTGYGSISRQFLYHAGQATEEHLDNGKVKSTPTTNLVKQILLSDGQRLEYEYDAEERITRSVQAPASGSSRVIAYEYDALGQLRSERVNGNLINTMYYDSYGNIRLKNGVGYTYGDGVWKDKLTGVGAETISYDAQGNPISYLGHTLTWEKGRQLKSFDGNTYTYNANGIRTSKTVNGVKHTYTLDGTKILRETWGNNVLVPLYDNEDSVCGILYNGTPYYFLKNLQGDIISVTDENGQTVAEYIYDAWGASISVSDSSDCGIGNINPFRYRGYYYDAEIGMYYLQSRYYDPEVGRFINGDEAIVSVITDNSIQGNLFSYCDNDPVNNTDVGGYFTLNSIKKKIKEIVSKLFKKFVEYLTSLVTYNNGKISIRLWLISNAIDTALFLIGSAASFLAKKWMYKTISKILFKNKTTTKNFLSWLIDLWKSTEVLRLVLWALSVVVASKARQIKSLLTDFTKNLLSAKSRILDYVFKFYELTSFAGVVAFLLGMCDGNPTDDYFTIKLW